MNGYVKKKKNRRVEKERDSHDLSGGVETPNWVELWENILVTNENIYEKIFFSYKSLRSGTDSTFLTGLKLTERVLSTDPNFTGLRHSL